MATIAENKQVWDGDYQWPEKGGEWSSGWGGAAMQWHGSILPRIHRHLPAGNILEIACGYGRWTCFLKNMCHKLVVVDLSNECIEACKKRFATDTHIEYYVNDGISLDMVASESADFVFSFDSLVHADKSVMESYLSQLAGLLKKEGVAFLHHSNLGEYQPAFAAIQKVPALRRALVMLGILDRDLHWRDNGVSAVLIEKLCKEYSLACISQEIVPWGTKRALIDCFSTIVRADSSMVRANRVMRNGDFMRESDYLSRLSRLYAGE